MAEELEYIPEIDRWRCRICGQIYVVPSLARDCETRCVMGKVS